MMKTKTRKILSLALSLMMLAGYGADPPKALATGEDGISVLLSEDFESYDEGTDILTLDNWGEANSNNNVNKTVATASGDVNTSQMMRLSLNNVSASADSKFYRNVFDSAPGGLYSLSFDAQIKSAKSGYGFSVSLNKAPEQGKDKDGIIILRNNFNTSDGISFKNATGLYKKKTAAKEWFHYEIVYNSITKQIALYLDGQEALPFEAITGNSAMVDTIGSVSFVLYRRNNVGDTVYFDDILLTKQSAAKYDAEKSLPASLVFEGKNFLLPTMGISGSTITWESSHPEIIGTDGTITPSPLGDTTVTLTATVSDGTGEDVKVPYEILIPKGEGGAILNPEDDGYVFLDEDFESLNDGDIIAGKDGGLKNWYLDWSESDGQILDSVFTVRQDSDDAENNVCEAGRSSSTNQSAQATMRYDFEEPIDSGVVECQIRVKRGDERLTEWSVMFYDTQAKPKYVNFRIVLADGRVKIGDNWVYFFNEETGTQNKGTSTYPVGKWVTFRMIMNLDENTCEFYQGDYCLGKDLIFSDPLNGQIGNIRMRTGRVMNTEESTNLYFDDLKVFRSSKKLTKEEKMAMAKEELSVWATANIFGMLKENVTLPTSFSSVNIKWSSDDESIVSPSGIVNRKWQQEQQTVLHATLSCEDITETVSYSVGVAALTEIMDPTKELIDAAIAEFNYEPSTGESRYGIRNDLILPNEYIEGTAAMFGGANIEWSASPAGIIAPDGKLSPTDKAENVTLTAKFIAKNDNKISTEKSFSMVVLPKGTSFMYETFEDSEAVNQPVHGWRNWKEVNESKETYVDDTEITIRNVDNSQNAAMEYKRLTVNDSSALVSIEKLLEKSDGENTSPAVINGGIANIRFRLKRNNEAKCLYIHLDDNKKIRESIRVNFNSNGLRPGLNAAFPDQIPFKKVPTYGVWLMVEIEIDYDNNFFDLSIYDEVNNHLETFTDLPMGANNGTLAGVGFSSTRSGDNKDGTIFLIDDLFITQTKEKVSEEGAVDKVCADIASSMENKEVSEDFTLSTSGEFQTTILWKSLNEDILQINGETAIVTPSDVDEVVMLEAAVMLGKTKKVITVSVNVPAFSDVQTPTQELVDTAVERYEFSEVTDENIKMITKDLALPTEYNKGYAKKIGGLDISWSSSVPYVVADDGKITKQKYDTFVVLTAVFTAKENPSLKAQKEFRICVLTEGEFIYNETFQEADYEKDMYKTIEETGVISPGNRDKVVYKDWVLNADSDSKKVNTDTMLVFDPENPYETVMNYTREQNNTTGDVPVTYTFRNFDKEYSSGVMCISMRFYLIGTKSRITVGTIVKGQTTGKASFNANYTRIAGVIRPVELNKWHDLNLVVYISENPTEANRYDVFLDGERMNEDQLLFKVGGPIVGMHISSVRTSDGPNGNWFVDDISVRHINYDSSKDVEKFAGKMSFGAPSPITGNLDLPIYGENGTRIVWRSSNPEVISDGGVVLSDANGKNVTLTATITKDSTFIQKNFPVKLAANLPEKPYRVISLKETDRIITGAEVENNDSSEKCVLITMLYSRGEVKEMRVCDLTAAEGQRQTVTFEKPIDAGSYISHEIRSYVYDTVNNIIISDITYGGGR